jgi:hypothetical protein
MKRRYVTLSRPRMDEDEIWNTEIERNLTVYERERQPQETGLLDKHGTRLYAINDPEPIGFIHFKEH